MWGWDLQDPRSSAGPLVGRQDPDTALCGTVGVWGLVSACWCMGLVSDVVCCGPGVSWNYQPAE